MVLTNARLEGRHITYSQAVSQAEQSKQDVFAKNAPGPMVLKMLLVWCSASFVWLVRAAVAPWVPCQSCNRRMGHGRRPWPRVLRLIDDVSSSV